MSQEEAFAAEVAKGGVWWRCTGCKRSGVIKSDAPYAASVRAFLKMPPPLHCGVEFTSIDCPLCSPGAEENTDEAH